ncbi:MAG TPA: 6-carboxytetrahydropterin synthase [Phycisphaerae bacterium]|nr:6-carboxytetrahydropterin synthase [Phycisphaerae bacterium]
MREIRFSIDRDWARAAHGDSGFEGALPVTNSWGGWPSGVGVAPYLVLRIVVSGVPDETTGYLVNIQELDMLLRRHAIPIAARELSEVGVALTGEGLLRDIHAGVAAQVPARCRLETLSLSVTPYLSYTIHSGDPAMVELTQCFEFSASHRLHVPTLSDEENRRTFGKCNNPNGHGHNYQVEVTVAGEVSGKTGSVLPLPAFESLVKREVIDRFDHKHLNDDTPEFANRNPSVENITRVVWDLLEPKVSPARLRRVRVWETAKTYAEYSSPHP